MIYSIGYGNRKFEEFVELLKRYEIAFLLDVRTNPYSQISPQFQKQNLEKLLAENGIKYAFFGNELGGKPDDPSVYVNGRVDYDLLRQKPLFKKGIERLQSADKQGHQVVIMCAELKPEECHRTRLIGTTLDQAGIILQHIDKDGGLVDQATVMARINKGKLNLFDEH